MNRFIRRAALFVVALGTVASVNSASAAIIDYQGNIDGQQEGTTSLGTGHAQVLYDNVAHSMRVIASFQGTTGDTTAAHIHAPTPAPFSGTAGVATMTPSFAGFPLGVKAGTMDTTFDLTQSSSWNPSYISANGGTPASAEAAFFSAMNAGRAYFNIHTTSVPGGEIRGFLTPAPVPVESATWSRIKALTQ